MFDIRKNMLSNDPTIMDLIVHNFPKTSFRETKRDFWSALFVSCLFALSFVFIPSLALQNIVIGLPVYLMGLVGCVIIARNRRSTDSDNRTYLIKVIIALLYMQTVSNVGIICFSVDNIEAVRLPGLLLIQACIFITQLIVICVGIRAQSKDFASFFKETTKIAKGPLVFGAIAGIMGFLFGKFMLRFGGLSIFALLCVILSLYLAYVLSARTIIIYYQYPHIRKLLSSIEEGNTVE